LFDVGIQRCVWFGGRPGPKAGPTPSAVAIRKSQVVVARPRRVLPARARHGTATAEPTPLIDTALLVTGARSNHPCPVPHNARAGVARGAW